MERIAAVVVTYNRLAMLRQCVDALLGQTRMLDIVIVDNASTDGTSEWAQSLENERICYRSTGENLGGAGGFHMGMRWAVEAGYDKIWIMDDDCLPKPKALETLLEADRALNGEYGWLSSRALWTDGSDCPMNIQRKTPYRDIDHFDQALIRSEMASFVSLFLRRETIVHYGLPIREFFIWADDWEYTRRISRHEPCYTVSASEVVHAMKQNTIVNIATDSPERMERYRCFYRNDVYLYRREGLKGWLWLISKDLWHTAQVCMRAKAHRMEKIRIIWKGFFAGIRFNPQIVYPQAEKDAKGVSL